MFRLPHTGPGAGFCFHPLLTLSGTHEIQEQEQKEKEQQT
jgi:hypothetical protein